MSDCPFCDRIAAGDHHQPWTPDPDVVWFRPLNPVTPGHMLFVPVCHVEDALEDPYTTAITAEIASRWWVRNWGRTGQRDCNLITSVGANATQTVRHLHLHLVPRRPGDGLALPWTGQVKVADLANAGEGWYGDDEALS
jgi:histidine triad (HIT) family protein